MAPRTLYRRIALAEVVTWALLLLGMVLKYVTRTTDLGVKIFGLAHGVVFIAFCLVTVLLWVNQRWTVREGLLGLLSAVPPFLTVWWERRLERRARLEGGWRLGRDGETPTNPAERVVATLLARPMMAVAVGVVAVLALTGVALVVGHHPSARRADCSGRSARSEPSGIRWLRQRDRASEGWVQMGAVAVLAGEVRAEGVGKTIDETTLLLPTDVSADPGDAMLVLRGPNGSGKTTLLRIIGGLLVPSTGTATIGGREADERDRAVRAAVAPCSAPRRPTAT